MKRDLIDVFVWIIIGSAILAAAAMTASGIYDIVCHLLQKVR